MGKEIIQAMSRILAVVLLCLSFGTNTLAGVLGFGKTLDLQKLASVMKLTFDEQLVFIKKDGVMLYRIENENVSGALAGIPVGTKANLGEIYDTFDFKQHAATFVSGENPLNKTKVPFIMLQVAASKPNSWYLVHEYMHHLFNAERLRQGFDAERVRLNNIENLRHLQTLSDHDLKQVFEFSVELNKLIDISLELILVKGIEEVVIENYLYEKNYVAEKSDRGKNYLKKNKLNTMKKLDFFIAKVDYIVKRMKLLPSTKKTRKQIKELLKRSERLNSVREELIKIT